ncbi:MAG: ABC transporter ATP-binding protein, partial [Ilumatobacteraceae bacterium]
MNRSAERPNLPPAMRSLWRTFRLGYRAEPRLLALSMGLALLMMLPDALLALWLKFLVDGVLHDHRGEVITAGIGLAVSVTATWYLSLLSQRVQRRFRDRVAIALESHV